MGLITDLITGSDTGDDGLIGGIIQKANKKHEHDNSGDYGGEAGGAVAVPDQYAKGGMVRKTGRAKVHAGERVLTASQNRSYERSKRQRRKSAGKYG